MAILTPEERKVKTWMKSNVKDALFDNGWEVNCTQLVEDAVFYSGLLTEEVLNDEAHFAWDLAVQVAEWYEGEKSNG